ncbi:hypothetical protein CBS63078_5829 [Aspergillus niger]|nr:hypothetical protein CBS63078_5829 [Aspergillus niger]KAI2918320.1 hypothetical protein CBS147371_4232 [Aspergillus niger]KAI2988916.1 hypothetical protein CBS147344_3491 [Aspergillus niger]KAI3024681.1 hypothetical protein CBS147345_3060 [Aspergillus niger]KAI3048319.1 hypothetical protein CBS147352_6333 [Aspergillus niger]
MFSKSNDEYQSAEAATSPSNKERNLKNEPGSSTLRFRALGLKTPSSPVAHSPERAASPLAVNQTQPASDGISHTLGSIQNYNESHLSPQQIDPALRPTGFTQSVSSTVSTDPGQARSPYGLMRILIAFGRLLLDIVLSPISLQRSISRLYIGYERSGNYSITRLYIGQEDSEDCSITRLYIGQEDSEVDIRRPGGINTLYKNRPLEREHPYRFEDAGTVQEDPVTTRPIDGYYKQKDSTPRHTLYSVDETRESVGVTMTQDKLRLLEDEASMTTDTPNECVDNALEVQENMAAEVLPRGPSPNASLRSKTSQGTLTILSRIGLRENDTRPGHKRIRWKNSRGKWLYDDYVEHVPGALEDMKAFLRSSAYVAAAAMDGGNQDAPASFTPSDYSTSSASQKQYTPLSEIADQSKGSDILHTSDSQTDVELGEMISHPPLLLSCLENGKYAVELRQESIVGVADDRQLFHTLRRIYHEHRGRLRPIWSLKTLHSIHFMKFAYGGTRYIDVRCHEDICQTGRPCVCVPPEHLVLPKGKEYDCRPIPPKLSPPIGPRLMMDFFMYPDYIAPNSSLIVQQLPKRACGKLQSEYLSPTEAWGIFYKEDWNWAKIWWILALGFFPPSLLFGILWTVFKQDISGAFGVASWWMAGASIIVGIVGTYDM